MAASKALEDRRTASALRRRRKHSRRSIYLPDSRLAVWRELDLLEFARRRRLDWSVEKIAAGEPGWEFGRAEGATRLFRASFGVVDSPRQMFAAAHALEIPGTEVQHFITTRFGSPAQAKQAMVNER